MERIKDKHWYAIEKIIDDLKEDQKVTLTANMAPIEIAKHIQSTERAIDHLIALLEDWKETFGYPNVSNLKYINRF